MAKKKSSPSQCEVVNSKVAALQAAIETLRSRLAAVEREMDIMAGDIHAMRSKPAPWWKRFF